MSTYKPQLDVQRLALLLTKYQELVPTLESQTKPAAKAKRTTRKAQSE